ncbi:MAG TPA: hypothetical protein VNO81_12985, partial [Candidatus Nitrosotenuis sp.]|nr:hypothetical protein [Candidatus Nitrosotenuis sp.]
PPRLPDRAPRGRSATSLLCGLLAALLLLGLGAPARAQEVQTDVPSATLNPLLIYILRQLEVDDPENTVFQVREASGTYVTTSGNLAGVAEYLPLDSTVRLKGFFFLKALEQGLLSVEADTDSTDSRRLSARFSAPRVGWIRLRDTRVLHRAGHQTRGVTQDFNPADAYSTKWERVQADGEIRPLSGEQGIALYAWVESQSRSGQTQHTFFQLHRFNCSNCHTYSASRGISQTTRSYQAALRGTLDTTFLEASLGQSDFDDNSTLLRFNYGGPFNNTVLTNANTHQKSQGARVFTGQESWRAGAQYLAIQRRNENNGLTLDQTYASAQAGWQPSSQVAVTGGFLSEDLDRSLAASLSRSRQQGFVEVSYFPIPELYLKARGGTAHSRYNLGAASSTNNNNYYELRAGYRPGPDLALRLRFRKDHNTRPFFPIDPADRTLIEAQASWSPDPVTVGVDYHKEERTNSTYSSDEETILGYLTVILDDGLSLFTTYSQTDHDANTSNTVFLDDQGGFPAQGPPLPLQNGVPYRARIRQFAAGLTVPIGQSGWRVRPLYRRNHSTSQIVLLPAAPSVSADSRLDLVQETYGFRVDVPLEPDQGQYLDLGWEQQRWRDLINSSQNGTFNYYMINYSTRF